ncbi:monovalent cation/H+ antiporter complex subunit F [Nesterenkonia sp. Act20]|uniref:monovalent cation/H+ antiporter complex subunit F n=1 Tax=Nesterenkonia sp. Act20 TaxID=1483432 RepID=UPI001C45AAC4|nr:cation:proton antiporter [Nesterenkonia sp. Act20]
MLETAVHITQVLLALGAAGTVYRIYKGPSVLDRVISLDVMLIIVASMMIVDMVINDHQDFILFVVVTAVIGFLGAVAIARYVVVRSPEEVAPDAPAHDPVPFPPAVPVGSSSQQEGEPETPHQPISTPVMPGVGPLEDESTSWFSALARSGFTPKRREDPMPEEAEPESRQPPKPESQPDSTPKPESTSSPQQQEDRDA